MKRVLLVVAVAACTKAGGEKQGQGAVVVVAKDDVPYSAPKTATAPKPAAGDLAWKVVDGPDALAAFARDAGAANLKPYAYLHAEWCGPCKAIEKTHAADPQMVDAFKGTAIALIDIDQVDSKLLSAAGMESSAIPVFFKLDASGKPTGDRIDGGAWGDNVPENMAPPLKAFFAK
jgi:thiol-disulfide isomerase/thioredoxin